MTSDKDRLDTVKKGKWVQDNDIPKEKLKRVGFHLSAFVAPYYMFSWSEATEMYEKSLRTKDDASMIVFDNTIRGLPVDYEGSGEDWEAVYAKRDNYVYGNFTAPSEDILFITCGVDVQGDRLEAGIYGWTDRLESYLLMYEVFRENEKNTSDHREGPWKQLAELLEKKITHPTGYEMPIDIAMIDSSDQTTTVYKFGLGYSLKKVRPVKGRGELRSPVSELKPCFITDKLSNKRKKTKGSFQLVGVSILKTELYQQLKLEPPNDEDECRQYPRNYHHFPGNMSEELFKQLCSEEAIITEVNGVKRIKYETTKHKVNEFLDVYIYNRAGLSAKGADLWTQAQWNRRRRRIDEEAGKIGYIKKALQVSEPKEVRARRELKKQMIPARTPDDIANEKMFQEKDTIDIGKMKAQLAEDRKKLLAKRQANRNKRN
jgi:phage terminase large subunit GpA-like protein